MSDLQFLGRGVPEVARTNLLKNKTLVGGKWVEAISKRTYPVYNPANSEVITEVRHPKAPLQLAVHMMT